MRQQIHLIQAQMDAQRLNIVDEPVNAEARRVRRVGRCPHAARVQQDQLPGCAEATEIAEILRGTTRPTGQAHQRRAITQNAIANLGSVVGRETRHRLILPVTVKRFSAGRLPATVRMLACLRERRRLRFVWIG